MRLILVCALLVAGCSKSSKAPPPEQQPGAVGGANKEGTTGSPPDGKGGPGRLAQLDLDDDMIVTGDIDKQTVKSTVKAHMAKLRVCYEQTLLANPGIEGKCVCTFKVAIDGSVREAKASGVHPDVEACVAAVVRSFKFPTSTAEVEVQYPFTFRAN